MLASAALNFTSHTVEVGCECPYWRPRFSRTRSELSHPDRMTNALITAERTSTEERENKAAPRALSLILQTESAQGWELQV